MSCPSPLDLARSVDGECTGNEQAALDEHVRGCARCRERVGVLRSIVADLAMDPVDLAGGDAATALDLAPLVMRRARLPPRRRVWTRFAGATVGVTALASAAAAAMLLRVAPSPSPIAQSAPVAPLVVASAEARPATDNDTGFRAKGARETADTWVALRPYRVDGKGTAPLPSTGGRMSAGDALLVAYDNGGPTPYHYLAVVGVDGLGRTHWLYPDASGGRTASVAIEPGVGRELRDEIRLPLAAGLLRLHALFSHRPLATTKIEEALRARKDGDVDAATRLPLPDTGQHEVVVQVDPLDPFASPDRQGRQGGHGG